MKTNETWKTPSPEIVKRMELLRRSVPDVLRAYVEGHSKHPDALVVVLGGAAVEGPNGFAGDELPTARGFLLGPAAAEAIGDLEQLAALAPVFDGHGLPIGISEPENGSTRRGPPRFASAEEQGAHHRLHRAASALRALERLDPHTSEALWLAFVACGPTVRARLDGAATDAHGGPGGFSGAAAVALLGAAGDGAELRRRGDELLAGALVAFLYARASDVPPVHRLDTAALRRRSDDLRGALMRHGTRAPGGVSAGRQ